jgi:hypothetical protein
MHLFQILSQKGGSLGIFNGFQVKFPVPIKLGGQSMRLR